MPPTGTRTRATSSRPHITTHTHTHAHTHTIPCLALSLPHTHTRKRTHNTHAHTHTHHIHTHTHTHTHAGTHYMRSHTHTKYDAVNTYFVLVKVRQVGFRHFRVVVHQCASNDAHEEPRVRKVSATCRDARTVSNMFGHAAAISTHTTGKLHAYRYTARRWAPRPPPPVQRT